jgi:excisionase family DNA binding protein
MTDLTVRVTADELDCSDQTVRLLIRSGDLKAFRLRGTAGPWRIRREALEEYRARQEAVRSDPWTRTRPRKTSTAA